MAGILTVIIGSILAGKVLLPKRESLKKIAILSIFQTSLQYFCFYVGLAHTTGVKSSILNGISVFVTIMLAALVFKQEKLTVVKLLGSILGFSGIVLVNLTGAGLDFSFHMQGEGMIILSTVCYGISSALIRIYGKDENPVVLSGYQFTLGGFVMMIIPYLFWDFNNPQHEYVMEVLKQREKLAQEGYFPSEYEGGLDFEEPGELHAGIPVDSAAMIEKRNSLIANIQETPEETVAAGTI